MGASLMDMYEREALLNEIRDKLGTGELSTGQAVRRLRKEVTGLQQERFAALCRISARALRQLEQDDGNPTVQTLNSVFNPFGMQVGIVKKPRNAPLGNVHG